MLKTRIGSFAALGVVAALVLGGAAVVLEGAAPATGAPGGPTVTVNQAATQADPTSTSPVEFSVVFSETVSGFTASDVDLSASTAGGSLTVVATQGIDAAHFTLDVSGMTSAGDVVVAIPADAATSAADPTLMSQASTTTDDSVTFTLPPAPTVTVDQAATQVDPTSLSPVEFSVVFSETVAGFTALDVDVSASTAGGALTVTVTQGVDAAHFTVDVSGMTSSGDVVVAIPSGAAESVANPGLTSLASTSTDDTVTYTAADGSAPLAIQVPPDVTVGNDSGVAGAHVMFAAPTSTGGVAPVTIECDATSGDFFPLGSTLVTCTATDSSVDGLSTVSAQAATASGSFTVTVLDTTPTTPTTPGGAVPGGSGASPAGTVIPASTSALAFTGSSGSPIFWIALGALVVGLVLLFGARRWFRESSGGS